MFDQSIKLIWTSPNTLTLWSKYGNSKRLWGPSLIKHYIALNIPHFDQRSKPARFIQSTFCLSNYHQLKAISRLINSARYNRFQLLSLINKNVDRISRPRWFQTQYGSRKHLKHARVFEKNKTTILNWRKIMMLLVDPCTYKKWI